MYRVDRNNFYKRQKKATIYTPDAVSQFIYDIIAPKIPKQSVIIDPCVGAGSLLQPFEQNGYKVFGIDIEKQGYPHTYCTNYLTLTRPDLKTTMRNQYGIQAEPNLVIMNPPFNIDGKTKDIVKKHYGGRPLLPEVWLMKALQLFGKDIPIVMFAPYGFRLNQTINSKRWQKFIMGEYPEITSIIALPKNIFNGILFHSEILIFNISGIKPHYFYQ